MIKGALISLVKTLFSPLVRIFWEVVKILFWPVTKILFWVGCWYYTKKARMFLGAAGEKVEDVGRGVLSKVTFGRLGRKKESGWVKRILRGGCGGSRDSRASSPEPTTPEKR